LAGFVHVPFAVKVCTSGWDIPTTAAEVRMWVIVAPLVWLAAVELSAPRVTVQVVPETLVTIRISES
jgi:hypothetical protein